MPGRSTQETPTVETALALLELPPLDEQTAEQVRGATCIWCPKSKPTPLTAKTAVNLGERRHKRLGGHFYTFPRCCRPCARKAADDALKAHAGCCEQCADDATLCEKAAALRQLMQEYQR